MLLYIFETKISKNCSMFYVLKFIYGLGKKKSIDISKKLGFCNNLKIKSLTIIQIAKLLKIVEISKLKITSDLKKFKSCITQNHKLIRSYKSFRKIQGLPVRGQRTHTNAKTSKNLKNFQYEYLV